MDKSNMDTTSTCDYSDPYSESFHPFLLFRIVLIKSAPAYAKHCSYWMNQVAYLIIYI